MTAFSLSATTGYASAVKDFPSTDLPCLLSPQAIGVIILFTGKQEQLDQNFIQSDGSTPSWKVMDDGSMLAMNSNILTKKDFGDILLHVEFKVPEMPEAKGQARGNSGIFIQGCYELQILDSFGIGVLGKTDCGAITNVQSPLFNACKAPKQWQSYDIIFRSPRYDTSGKTKLEHAHITAFLNGILVQNNVEVHDSFCKTYCHRFLVGKF